jgi:hypothetical protein
MARACWIFAAALLAAVACALGSSPLHPRALATVRAPRKEALEAALGGREAAKPYIRSRLVGWPTQLLVDRRTLPEDDREFLTRLARDTWRGLEALSDRENGLPIDHVRFSDSLDPKAAKIGDYASTTNLGLYLVAIVAAHELGLIPESEAQDKLGTVLDSIDRLETWRGFPFNFYDTTTLERTSDFVSFVDSSWLAAGLMVVRTSFPPLAERCTASLAARDFGHFYDPRRKLMSHGEYVDPQQRSPYHYGVFYTEARLGSLIAIGKGDVPAEHWFAMTRTPPPPEIASGAAGHFELARVHPWPSAYYEWKGLHYVPSWGGSMFEALMPTLVLDERTYAPSSLGRNDEVHAVVQRRYALEVLGLPVWGMSPSWQPSGERYSEHGVAPLGFHGYDGRAVTPHAAALALGVTPQEAIADLRELARRYDVYGEYGFYDAVDPASGEVAHVYLTLDQAMILIALANHLEDGVIQRRFVADPIAQAALPLLRDENFFEGGASLQTSTEVGGPAPPRL